MMINKVLTKLHHSIIVSVQADQGEPLNKPECILAMSMSVIDGGASGLRLANPDNIQNVKTFLPDIPVIGITKPLHKIIDYENHVYITPTLWTAESVCMAGADIIAMDATLRERPMGESLSHIVSCIRERFPDKLLMADIATEKEANTAYDLGFDIIATTLSGYTSETSSLRNSQKPDFELLAKLVNKISLPVILEGRLWEPCHVSKAFEIGAFAVVIGSAITRPQLITRRFVSAIPTLKQV